ncbi:MAG: hypothetical protein HQL08_01260 [Nitrospirae bacterium]|nr:hypothetical protein [Nitrospirota bacterium]
MNKMNRSFFKNLLIAFFLLIIFTGTAFAHEDEGKKDESPADTHPGGSDAREIPEKISAEHWAYREVEELGKKYAAEKKLPCALDDKTCACTKRELAECLLSILDKIIEQHDKGGTEAIPREDLNRIAALHEMLKEELSRYDAYTTRRETIEKILAAPEVPGYEYRLGVNGFIRSEGVGNFKLRDLSYVPEHSEGRFLYRIKPYAYWSPTDYLDIHLEGQGYGFLGGSRDTGKFSLYQGFVEAKIPGKDWLALKGGRQEFTYGSTFILGSNSFFSGLSFDAARLRVQPIGPLTIDLLGGRYATPFSNGLQGNLAGGYATYAFSEGNAIEAYAFRDTGSADHNAGEHLDIWGLRGTTKFGPVTLELEPVFESGQVLNPLTGLNDGIGAYGGHVDLTEEATLAGYHNKFFESYAIGSGNRNAANGVKFNREFRNPDNDTSLVGDMHVVGDLSGTNVAGHHASGLNVFTLGWGIDITKQLNFSATGHYFLANSVEYGFSRNIGLETDFNMTYSISDDFSVIAAYDHFFTGDFFQHASGISRDINYGYVMLQFNFAKTKLKPQKL